MYAYAVGCPLRLLSPRGAWEECVVIDRAPGTNQHVVRLPPVGHLHWTLLLPWNHAPLALHPRVPLFAVRGYERANWLPLQDDSKRSGALGMEASGPDANEMADLLEKRADDDLSESAATLIEVGQKVEFVLNIRAASRSWRSWRALWCPGVVVGIHRKPTRSAALAGALVSKTVDIAAGGYCFDASWATDDQPLLVRELSVPTPSPADAAALAAADVLEDGAAAAWPGSIAAMMATAHGDLAPGSAGLDSGDEEGDAELDMELDAELDGEGGHGIGSGGGLGDELGLLPGHRRLAPSVARRASTAPQAPRRGAAGSVGWSMARSWRWRRSCR